MASRKQYNNESRQARTEEIRQSILRAARKLFAARGFDKTTIDAIASRAGISGPTVYSLFKSKEGILRELMNVVLFGPPYQALVEKSTSLADPIETLKMAASITRLIYDAGRSEMACLQGAGLSPALRRLQQGAENQRYERQEFVVLRLEKAGLLPSGMTAARARDVLWALTSRDLYRMMVSERGWSSDDYEEWLRRTLLQVLVR